MKPFILYYLYFIKKLSDMLYGHENESDLLHISYDGKYLSGKIYKEENLKNFSTKYLIIGNISVSEIKTKRSAI